MKTRLLMLFLIGMLVSVSIAYVGAQEIPWHHYDKCLEMGKLPKIDKINEDTYMRSCVELNPFGK